jgi:hypothetical protein
MCEMKQLESSLGSGNVEQFTGQRRTLVAVVLKCRVPLFIKFPVQLAIFDTTSI